MTPNHCKLKGDSVQWLSQLDYSICIHLVYQLVEFYQECIEYCVINE